MFGISVIASFISAAVEFVKKVVEIAKPVIEAIGNAILEIGKLLKIIPEEETVDELGEKALQAEENDDIKPENYDSYEEYINAVEGYEKYDPEKRHTPDERLAKGTEIATVIALEKCPAVNVDNILALSTIPGIVVGGRYAEICKLVVTNPDAANAIGDFFKKTTNSDVIDLAKTTLIGIEKQVTPGISDVDALKSILQLQNQNESK